MCDAACAGAIDLNKDSCHPALYAKQTAALMPASAQTHWKLWLVRGWQTAKPAYRVSQLPLQKIVLFRWSWLCLHPTQRLPGWDLCCENAMLAGTVATAKHRLEVPAGGLACPAGIHNVP